MGLKIIHVLINQVSMEIPNITSKYTLRYFFKNTSYLNVISPCKSTGTMATSLPTAISSEDRRKLWGFILITDGNCFLLVSQI